MNSSESKSIHISLRCAVFKSPAWNIIDDFYQVIKISNAENMLVCCGGESDDLINAKGKSSHSYHKYFHPCTLQTKCLEQGHFFTNVWQSICDKQNVSEAFRVKARTVEEMVEHDLLN